jgi:two-component system chemotaxis sensor kinase CheA
MLDDALYGDFMAECDEHLADIEEDILTMESQGSDIDLELINKTFRAIHSIKGGAGFLGLNAIQKLSHLMENLLDLMRTGQCVPDHDNCRLLLTGVDELKSLLADPEHGDGQEVEGLRAELTEAVHRGGKAPEPGTVAVMVAHPHLPRFVMPDGGDCPLVPDDADLWFNKLPEHIHTYLIALDLHQWETDNERTLLDLVNDINGTGSILASRIVSPIESLEEALPVSGLHGQFLFVTMFDPSLIASVLRVPDDAIAIIATEEVEVAEEPAATQEMASDVLESNDAASTSSTPAVIEPKAADVPAAPAAGKKPAEKKKVDATPQFVRVNLGLLDDLMSLAGELVLVRNRQLLALEQSGSTAVGGAGLVQQLNAVTNDLQDAIMRTRMQPVATVFAKMPRLIHDLSDKLNKKLNLTMIGKEVEVDKTILENLADPLTHLLRNAGDHGIEMPSEREAAGKDPTGQIQVSARHDGGQIVVEIRDDGKGIDPSKISAKAVEKGVITPEQAATISDREAINLIFHPGFSTAAQLSDVSGRGVGMDVVKSSLESIGGTCDVSSVVGVGSVFTLRLPLTLAIVKGLTVREGGDRYILPQSTLEEVVRLYADENPQIESAGAQVVYRLRGELLPLVPLSEILRSPEALTTERKRTCAELIHHRATTDRLTFAVIRAGHYRYGLVIDDVVGAEEIVVKPMHQALKAVRIFSGCTVMGDGSVAMICDVSGIAQASALEYGDREEAEMLTTNQVTERVPQLLFTACSQEQLALPLPLIKRIVTYSADDIETVAGRKYLQLDGESIRILELQRHIPLTAEPEEGDERLLILPRHLKFPVGIAAKELLDVHHELPEPDAETLHQDGVVGSMIVNDHTTLFLDFFRLAELEEPGWFEQRKELSEEAKPRVPDGIRVLLAEDMAFFRRLIASYLQADGYRVTTCEDGQEAWDLLQTDVEFDVLVSDLEMPNMDGFELIKHIRGDARWRNLPAISVSALHTEEAANEARASGFDVHEIKIDRERLLTVLAQNLDRRGRLIRMEEGVA